MARRGRPTVTITLTDEERDTLMRWTRRHSSAQALAARCRLVLGCADGLTNTEVAAAAKTALIPPDPAIFGRYTQTG
jgi:hypothetical protein